MSAVSPQALAAAKELVSGVVSGAVDLEARPALLEDDILYIQVGIVEKGALGWLETLLGDDRHPKDNRLVVAMQLTGPGRSRILAALGFQGLST
jgi:hypothetical protein